MCDLIITWIMSTGTVGETLFHFVDHEREFMQDRCLSSASFFRLPKILSSQLQHPRDCLGCSQSQPLVNSLCAVFSERARGREHENERLRGVLIASSIPVTPSGAAGDVVRRSHHLQHKIFEKARASLDSKNYSS